MTPDTINYSTLQDLTDELLASKNNVRIYVAGNSMYPHLRQGDYVTVAKTPYEKLKVGDIIVFKGLYHNVAHRIIKILKTNDGFLILPKGDSSERHDMPISEDKYFGKIISFERNGKKTELESSFYKRYNVFLATISPYTPVVYGFVRFFKHLFCFKKQKVSSL